MRPQRGLKQPVKKTAGSNQQIAGVVLPTLYFRSEQSSGLTKPRPLMLSMRTRTTKIRFLLAYSEQVQ